MMKKFLFALSLSGMFFTAFANLNGNGYYRVMNFGSSRWANLIDDKASVDFFAGSADLHSMQLTNDTEAILSSPGSVVYINQVANNQYDVAAQGVTLESLVDNTIKIQANGTSSANNQTLYRIYGTYKGVTKYIGDSNIITIEEFGNASLNVSNVNFNKWYIMPLDAASDNYFGAVPSVTAGNNYYTTLFTSFAYKPYSAGVKAYYISRVGYGMAEMVEITGAVPPGSPVVIQCAGQKVSDNRMQIEELQDVLPANALTGVYFNYYGSKSYSNRVAYDPKTMRVLGVCSDGSLGFVTSDIEYIPANSAYLTVPEGSLPEIKCVSTAEYEQNLPQAPEQFYFGDTALLLPQGDDNYSGTFTLPASTSEDMAMKIRFYASSTRADDNFIGAYSPNNTDVYLTAPGSDLLPFQYGSDNYWVLADWFGGDLTVTLNLKYQYIKFQSQRAGIDSVISSPDNLLYDGESVICESASHIAIYNMAGQLMTESKNNSCNVSGLPKGVYVAVANGKSIKIVR